MTNSENTLRPKSSGPQLNGASTNARDFDHTPDLDVHSYVARGSVVASDESRIELNKDAAGPIGLAMIIVFCLIVFNQE